MRNPGKQPIDIIYFLTFEPCMLVRPTPNANFLGFRSAFFFTRMYAFLWLAPSFHLRVSRHLTCPELHLLKLDRAPRVTWRTLSFETLQLVTEQYPRQNTRRLSESQMVIAPKAEGLSFQNHDCRRAKTRALSPGPPLYPRMNWSLTTRKCSFPSTRPVKSKSNLVTSVATTRYMSAQARLSCGSGQH